MTVPLTLSMHTPPERGRNADGVEPSQIPTTGSAPCPPIDIAAAEMHDLAFNLIRVLDDDGTAVGPWADLVHLDDGDLREGLRHMMTLRTYDTRMQMAQRQQKTSFYMQHRGEEAVSCGFQRAMRPGDMNFPTYRQAGLLIAAGYPIKTMMCQVFGNSGDPAHGRQLPVFYSSREHGFFSISGNLATQYIQAVGWAMGSALSGDDKIAAAWIGDGATAESDFHAALVFASSYRVPVVLNIVNNQWAISTFQSLALGSAGTFAARGHGFGIPALRVDGNDYLAVVAAARWATERARANLGPTLIEHVTYRVAAHSSSDDPSAYRSNEDAARWPLGDPVVRLRDHLIRRGTWSAERHIQAEAEILDMVIKAQKGAEAIGTLQSGDRPHASALFDDVFAQMPPHLQRQKQQAGV